MYAVERDCAIIEQHMRYWALGEAPDKWLNDWQSTRVRTDESERTVYSYGRHFPLATVYPRGRHKGLILLNGDEWRGNGWHPSRTPDHQSHARRVAESIAAQAPGWRVVILPISALDGAGIDGATIKPLEVRPDTWNSFSHSAILPRDTFGAEPTRGMIANPRAYDWRRNRVESEPLEIAAPRAIERRRVTLAVESSGNGLERAGIAASASATFTVTRETVWSSGGYGRDGWQETELDKPRYEYGLVGAIGTSSSANHPTRASAQLAPDGESIELGWSSSRHWLGDSLFTAERVSESSRPCHTANPAASEGDWCEQCGGSLRRDGFERQSLRRRFRWLSSFDYNEPNPLYFLAALPRGSRAQTVSMALDDLAPAAVHSALARGLAVERQGDIFLIPTALADSDLERRGADFARLTMFTRDAKSRKGELGYSRPLDAAGRRRMAQWRRREFRRLLALSSQPQPQTDTGARKRFAAMRREHAASLATLDTKLRAAILGAHRSQASYSSQGSSGLSPSQNRRAILAAVTRARQSRDYCRRLDGRDSHGNRTVAQARDRYRLHNANRALELWRQSGINANLRFRPLDVWQSAQANATRGRIREALAVYGTAHTATRVAVTKAGTYVQGTVRHVPAVARETRDSDHRALELEPNVWYLAVRNTVPRMVGTVPARRRW